ncbi:hypothetical protein WA026_006838 [Henosepilachna vigintioctopunctata]|uniref:Calponin-homology (CH) domain-containing protein n=1 Tax=Henosepilachna vigintioctopunctata TaxID=420089 RepID=A0AAW1UAV2_9CUCU
MFFQVSPVRSSKPNVSKPLKTEEDEIATLTLAPFSSIPKLSFHNTLINTSYKIQLILTNPRPIPVKVNVSFDGSEDINLSLSWNEEVIEGNSDSILEIVWCPIQGYSSRHSLRLTCQKQIWNIPISFKSLSPKKCKQKKKISTTLVKKRSPITKLDLKKNSQKLSTTFRRTLNPNPAWNSTPYLPESRKTIYDKENIANEMSESFVSPSNILFHLHPPENIRRCTYAVNKSKSPKKKLSSPESFDSLEINSSELHSSPAKNRTVLKHINGNNSPTLEELLLYQKSSPLSYRGTPVINTFLPKRVSTERKKDYLQVSPNESSHVNRNLSLELKSMSQCTLPNINISSETHVIGNLSFESSERIIDSNTYVKQNISTETFTKYEIETTHGKYSHSPLRNEIKGIVNISPVPYDKKFVEVGINSSQVNENIFFSNKRSPSIKSRNFPNERSVEDKEFIKSLRLKRKSDIKLTAASPSKRQNLTPETWSKTGCAYGPRINKQSSKLLQIGTPTKDHINATKSVCYKETKTLAINDPFILAATISFDPFLNNTIYIDQEWIEQQEERFKRWFNMLLTPPSELNVEDEGHNIDAAKLWRECTQKEVALAPTKEVISNKYHTVSRLEFLRKTAMKFYMSEEIQIVLSKIGTAIEVGKLEIRQDKNVHLDLSLQSNLMSLILSYNPLWLRIGLETIYKVKLQLASNSDVLGLSKFLYDRFFKDPYLSKKYKSVHSLKYNSEIKKFILRKYLTLVYFLDKAKMKALISHDPCLFRRNAVVKESKDMLIHFAKDTITGGVGDVNRYLKYFGYVVNHKQLYIHEYDYAVINLGGDLRDGVRLTRVMEIILMKNDLTEQLRVPAISRLQKIHNVKIVFKSLIEHGYDIQHEIEPYHIVDGHREKTLSFLWQIIYKFQAPLVLKSVKHIQVWWRSLPIQIKRNKLRKNYERKVDSAIKIQRWYRRKVLSVKLLTFSNLLKEYLYRLKRERAATKIQSYFKMYIQFKTYAKIKTSILKLQKQCRAWLNGECYRKKVTAAIVLQKNVRRYLARSKYVQLKESVLTIEQLYIAKKLMLREKQHYQQLKSSATLIQQWYKASIIAKTVRDDYCKLKKSVCFIQEKFKSKLLMKKAVNEYQTMKSSIILIQIWYRSIKVMKGLRNDFLQKRNSVRTIENYFIAYREMKNARKNYLCLRRSTIVIQMYLKATLKMRKERKEFLSLKKASELIKSKYKANKLMRIAKQNFQNLRRAAIFVQRRFRANKFMKIERTSYSLLKGSTMKIQRYFRSYILMKRNRRSFIQMKESANIIQKRYRAYRAMCLIRKEYCIFKNTVVFVQKMFRNKRLMKMQRKKFLEQKNSCIKIQQYFRGYLQMKKERQQYLTLVGIACLVQQKYRAKRSMAICNKQYIKLKEVTIMIQRRFRANKLMHTQKIAYLHLKSTVNFIKTKYIAKQMMIRAQKDFQKLKKAVILIQRKYRAIKLMKKERIFYLQQKKSAIIIQKYFRMWKQRKIYLRIIVLITNFQRLYRGHRTMLLAKNNYENLKKAVILVQRKYRANKIMKFQRCLFLKQREAANIIQNKFRSYLLMKKYREQYMTIKSSAVIIQRRYRAHKLLLKEFNNYQKIQKSTLFIQRLFRANRIMKIERGLYVRQRNATIVIQRYFRSYLLMKRDRARYTQIKKKVLIIEQWYAAYRNMLSAREKFIALKKGVILIQTKFRANKLMQKQRKSFLNMRTKCIIIQRYFRGFILMKMERNQFLQLKMVVGMVEQKYKAKKLMEISRATYVKLKEVTIFIQRKYRATQATKFQRAVFMKQKDAAVKIQRFFRGYQQMKICRTYFLNLIKSVRTIQRYGRGFLVRRTYAPLLTAEAREERRIRKIQETAAIKIQANWRGYIQRSKDENNLKLIRKRCKDAQTNAQPQHSLERRSEQALELLVNEDITIPLIISALSDFEYVTRRSQVICRNVGPILPEQLYLLIKSVARSLPEIQINVLSTYILINLCKYPPTTALTWFPEHLDSMLNIMIHWCDKEEMVFPSLCTLFWLFAHNREYKQVILELPYLHQKLIKINGLVVRKQKMVIRSVTKLSNSKFHSTKYVKLPGLKPDWGFDYPDRPRTFINSVHAIQCLQEILK